MKDVRANGSKSWTFWGRLAQPVIALLGFITLFFPAIRVLDEFNIEGQAENLAEELGLSEELSAARDELGLHTTQNFLTHDMVFIGVILLLLFLATIGLALASLVTNKAVLRLAAGGIGGMGGLVGIIVSIIYLVAAGEDHLTVGFGAVLMLIPRHPAYGCLCGRSAAAKEGCSAAATVLTTTTRCESEIHLCTPRP